MSNVLIPLAQGCEELEAVTLIDLLRRAGIEVVTAGLDNKPVVCSRGTCLIPDTVIDKVMNTDFDMIVLPGGLPGADNLNKDQRVRELILKMAAEEKYTAAICAAPKVLASTGLLDHKTATSFPGVLDEFEIDGFKYSSNSVVQDGKVITSRGPGTAIDFSLHLIELLSSKKKRLEVESGLQRSEAVVAD